uniref:Uncharacterized protein n=1 Tax=Desertifilum tharense IPPAS B-1220 TaxID=1781255 RepID=A0ACD5GYP4_9CYAN
MPSNQIFKSVYSTHLASSHNYFFCLSFFLLTQHSTFSIVYSTFFYLSFFLLTQHSALYTQHSFPHSALSTLHSALRKGWR